MKTEGKMQTAVYRLFNLVMLHVVFLPLRPNIKQLNWSIV